MNRVTQTDAHLFLVLPAAADFQKITEGWARFIMFLGRLFHRHSLSLDVREFHSISLVPLALPSLG